MRILLYKNILYKNRQTKQQMTNLVKLTVKTTNGIAPLPLRRYDYDGKRGSHVLKEANINSKKAALLIHIKMLSVLRILI